jgi:hypothetical protein
MARIRAHPGGYPIKPRLTMSEMPDGTSGQVLTAQGAGVDPVWAAAARGMLLFSGQSFLTATTNLTAYFFAAGGKASVDCPTTEGFDSYYICSRAGIIKNLFVETDLAAELGKDIVITVRKNGVDQTLTCTLSEATTANDTANSFSVAAGDKISVKELQQDNASDHNIIIGMEYA